MQELTDIQPTVELPNLPEVLFKEVVTSGPGAIVIVDVKDLNIIFTNRQFKELFGYEQTGFSFANVIDDFQLARLRAQIESTLHNVVARSKYFVYRLKRNDGSYLSSYLYAAPVNEERLDEGRYYHFLILSDISKWNLPFTSFDTRELFMEQFSKEGFGTFEWLIGTDQVFWTEGIYSIYEIDYSETISYDSIKKYVHAGDKERVDEVMKNAMEHSEDVDVEFRLLTEKKNLKWIHSLGRMIKDGNGNNFKFVGSIRDITSQRDAEDNLKSNVEELNRSNAELEEFAYVASHDMQEPLRKITTFSDRLFEKYKDVLTGDGAMYLERMMASAENMRSLINNLLEFSRVSKSTQPFTETSLNFILYQVKTDLELVIEETGTELVSPVLPIIEASMTQMKQLFTNIINNAIKFHKPYIKPSIKITVNTATTEELTAYDLPHGVVHYKIAMTDNGIGFESIYATRIFQVFQRLHGKSEYPGSGIGLAICKKIVERHKGIIYAENIPGQGARFVFILPEKQNP